MTENDVIAFIAFLAAVVKIAAIVKADRASKRNSDKAKGAR